MLIIWHHAGEGETTHLCCVHNRRFHFGANAEVFDECNSAGVQLRRSTHPNTRQEKAAHNCQEVTVMVIA